MSLGSLAKWPQWQELSQSEARSLELLPGLPRRCRQVMLWVIFDCFPRPQAESWMQSRAAGIRTGAHMGSWHVQDENLNHYTIMPCPSFCFKDLFYFYWKVRYTERRKDKEEDLLSIDSLPQVAATAGAEPIRSKELLRASHKGAGSQSFGPSSTAFPSHKQGVGWEAWLLGLEPVPIWDPSAFKARTLATRPHCWAQQ